MFRSHLYCQITAFNPCMCDAGKSSPDQEFNQTLCHWRGRSVSQLTRAAQRGLANADRTAKTQKSAVRSMRCRRSIP